MTDTQLWVEVLILQAREILGCRDVGGRYRQRWCDAVMEVQRLKWEMRRWHPRHAVPMGARDQEIEAGSDD